MDAPLAPPPPPGDARAPGARLARAAGPVAAVCLAAYALLALTVWTVPGWQPRWDCSMYLLTAQSLAAGEGYAYQGEPFFLRPPGLSAVVSLLVEPDAFDPLLLNRLVMAWAAVAVAAIYAALRPLHGPWIALAVALLTGTSPFFVRTFNFLFAEYPFLALLFGGCGMLHASARRGPRWWLWALGGALCLAAAAWLRTVAVLALPGALLVGLRADRGVQRWRPLVGAALPVLLILPWMLHSGRVAQGARSPADQFLLFDYGTAMLHVDPGDPASPRVDLAGWVERVAANGGQLLGDLDEQLAHLEGVTAWRWPAAVLVLAGLAVALRRRPSMFEAWTALYVALVLTYFVYANRLVQPLVPFLYLYALLALAALGRLVARRLGPVAGALPAAALFAALLLGNALAFGHHRSPRAWPYAGATQGQWWDDLEATAAWVRENTPADATLLCNAAPTLSVMSGRRAYTYRFPRGTDLFQRYPIDYVVHDAGAVPAHVQQRILRAGRPPALVESHVPGQFIKIWSVR